MWLHFISHYTANFRLFKHIKTKITTADIMVAFAEIIEKISFVMDMDTAARSAKFIHETSFLLTSDNFHL